MKAPTLSYKRKLHNNNKVFTKVRIVVSLYVSMSVCLSICLSVSLSVSLYLYQSVSVYAVIQYMSRNMTDIQLSQQQLRLSSVYMSICHSVCLSLSVCMYACICLYLSVCLCSDPVPES